MDDDVWLGRLEHLGQVALYLHADLFLESHDGREVLTDFGGIDVHRADDAEARAGDDLAHSSIRFGLGRFSTEEEVDYVVDKLTSVVRRLREMSPLYEMVKEGVDLTKMQWVTH